MMPVRSLRHIGANRFYTRQNKQQPEAHSKKELKAFKYMGSYFPSAKSEDSIILTSLLPPIKFYSSESEIRHEIGVIIRIA